MEDEEWLHLDFYETLKNIDMFLLTPENLEMSWKCILDTESREI